MTTNQITCPYCKEEVVPSTYGDCTNCWRNIVIVMGDGQGNLEEIPRETDRQLKFYCAVCDSHFISEPDDSGYDQAPCPKCGDLSCTDEFYAQDRGRVDQEQMVVWLWVLKIVAILLFTGLGWAILQSMFKN